MDAAQGADQALQSELPQLWTETKISVHPLARREMEIEALVSSRERTIVELEIHSRATMSLVGNRNATIPALEARLANTQTGNRPLPTATGQGNRTIRYSPSGNYVEGVARKSSRSSAAAPSGRATGYNDSEFGAIVAQIKATVPPMSETSTIRASSWRLR